MNPCNVPPALRVVTIVTPEGKRDSAERKAAASTPCSCSVIPHLAGSLGGRGVAGVHEDEVHTYLPFRRMLFGNNVWVGPSEVKARE
ncbi:hypothetical protein GCM10017744_091900 [Streptomyces antimycoticus]